MKYKKITQIPLALMLKIKASGLSSKLIAENKKESETFSIELAGKILRSLGIPHSEIKVVRVKENNVDFREYCYRNLVLVREQTYVRDNHQFSDREIYPFLCQEKSGLRKITSDRIENLEKKINSDLNSEKLAKLSFCFF